MDGEIDHALRFRLGEGRGEVDRALRFDALPLVFREIERVGFERAVAARLAFHRANAVLVIIVDRFTAAAKRLVGGGIANDEIILTEMIEQGFQPLFEQRQPMLHPRHPAPFGQRLVKRVLGRGRAELLAIAGAEALDAVGVEQGLGSGHQGEGVRLVGRSLVGGVEAPDAVDLVPEEIEPERELLAGREDIDRASRGRHIRHARRRYRRAGSRARLAARQAPRAGSVASSIRRVSWRMRNGVRTRCVAALAVATSSCGLSTSACSALSVASRSAITRRAGEARS